MAVVKLRPFSNCGLSITKECYVEHVVQIGRVAAEI